MNTIPVFKADWEPKLWRTMSAATALSAALVMLALVFGAEYNHSTATSANVNRTYGERVGIDGLMVALLNAETAQRGYIISGDSQFLDLYRASRARFDSTAATLQTTFERLPEQERRLARLRELADAKFAEMETTAAARRSRGLGAAAMGMGFSQGKRLMDAIGQTHAALVAEQGRILEAGLARQRARILATKRLIWSLVVMMAASAFGLGYLFWRTRTRSHGLALKAVRFGTRQNAIFAAAQDAIILLNPSGRIDMVNPAAERLFAYAARDLLGSDIALLVDLAPGDGAFLDRIGFRAGALADPFRTHLHARRRDGALLPLEVSLGAMDLPDGIHIVAAFRDVSEREQGEELRRRFLSTVSHELRTPLTSIVGSLGLLRGGVVADPSGDVKRLVEIAESNAGRLIRLVNDLLDIEKLEAGAMTFAFELFDIRSALRDAADSMRGLADARSVGLRTDLGDASVLVRGDCERLVQVVSNLLSNAVRFSPQGNAVILSLEATPLRVTVSVRDHGPGIDSELGRRLFTRFGQGSRPVGMSAGTGLGLTIAREIVSAHGGRIWHAITDEGALFCFELPVSSAAEMREADAEHMLSVA